MPEPAIATTSAFPAGSVMLNALNEELPENRQSRFAAFALGAGSYATGSLAVA